METKQVCPECGAAWKDAQTCQDHFHQMLFWENEYPGHGEVHHLMVLSYYLQHPSLYSPEGLKNAIHLLVDFLDHGVRPEEARRRDRAKVDSGKRTWKIKATPASAGSYRHPVRWTMTAGDVISGGAENYCASVRLWARSILDAIHSSNNFTPVSTG